MLSSTHLPTEGGKNQVLTGGEKKMSSWVFESSIKMGLQGHPVLSPAKAAE